MSSLRIIFYGTPEFAVASLNQIHTKSNHTVEAVVTAPDRPAGRGKKMRVSAVKEYALEKNIRVFQPTNLKSDDFIQKVKEINPDVQVVVAFRMMPKVIWSIPKHGTFNLHASLLPQYRGAAPINWALINGEKETGTTTFFIDEKIDTGAIILQEHEPISNDDNVGDLHDRLMLSGAKLVVETLDRIALGKVETKRQMLDKNTEMAHAPKLTKENTRLDWEKEGSRIINSIQGLSPYPGAWTKLQNGDTSLVFKIFKASFTPHKHDKKIGSFHRQENQLSVYCTNGLIELIEIQVEGKRRMDVSDFLRGFNMDQKAFLN